MKFRLFFAKKIVYIPLSAVVLIVGGIMVYSALNQPVYETVVVEERDFLQEVSMTGRVVASKDISLAFESGGRVSSVPAVVGTKVNQATVLASVGSGDLYASLLGARARQQSAQADLDAVLRGSRPIEISNLEDSVRFAKADLVLAIKNAYLVTDDSLRSKIDVMFTNPTGSYPGFVDFGDGSRRDRIEDTRVEMGNMLKVWKKDIDALTTENYKSADRVQTLENLQAMLSYVEELVIASSYFEDSNQITDAQRVTYTANISSARSAINASISAVNSSNQSYISAQGKLDLAAEGSTQEEIARAQASVKNAQASVLQAQASLAKTSIRAPFTGIVTKVDVSVGGFVSPGTPVVSMISDSNFEIESFVPEADIAKVLIGNTGTTTLDAYGDDVQFGVVVTAIDLSQTEVQGVSTYKTSLQFVSVDDRIRSGMTANIDLASQTRPSILSVPQSAIVSVTGKRTVLIMKESGKTESRDVTTGTIDNFGNIEIKSGLSIGEVVVTNPKK